MHTRADYIKDIAGALLFVLVGGIFLREMSDLPANVSKYPSVLIYLIMALCMVLIAQAAAHLASGKYMSAETKARIKAEDPFAEDEPEKVGFPTIFVLVISFLYVAAMPYVGFTVASAVMMLAFMLAMGIRSIPVLVLVPAVEIAFLLYVFEKLLAVLLPDAEWLKTLLGIL